MSVQSIIYYIDNLFLHFLLLVSKVLDGYAIESGYWDANTCQQNNG